MNSNRYYKIIIVDPSPIVVEGLKHLLHENSEFTVAGHIDSFTHFKERALALRPDVLIINPTIIDFDKRFSLRSLFQDIPNMVILALLYSYVDSDILRQYNGVIEIYDTYNAIENKLYNALSSQGNKKEQFDGGGDLTEREIAVLISVAKGLMNKEIADKLSISIHTVISHRKNISRKTGIKTVSGLTVYAMINNLINRDEV
ncbi:MAG: response regulator transcription factor [Bacteroidales bacterium]|jgi:DNA-binding NarL/FixJ family response regulator|nr:response regulator transcription factor [Bacteroidales bacterium]